MCRIKICRLQTFLLAACYYEKALKTSDITVKEQLFAEAYLLFVDLLKIEQSMPIVNLYLAKMYLASYGVAKQTRGRIDSFGHCFLITLRWMKIVCG